MVEPFRDPDVPSTFYKVMWVALLDILWIIGNADGFFGSSPGHGQTHSSADGDVDPGVICPPLTKRFWDMVRDDLGHILVKDQGFCLDESPGTRMPTGGDVAVRDDERCPAAPHQSAARTAHTSQGHVRCRVPYTRTHLLHARSASEARQRNLARMSSLHWQESYVRIASRRWRRGTRGFRLCPRNRFSVRRLRAEMLTFLGLVGRYVGLLVRRLSTSRGSGAGSSSSRCARSGSRRVLVAGKKDAAAGNKAPPRTASFMRSNSFYAQAIADCLEFIKRNSVPVEDYGSVSARR
ncbi:uncharacterized protein LOC133918061 [Phragmites australis]|uniref:uncharacterized protein LOC133918061 n=1 Tax=Phragmites australis TaxID=29695 RepID=UPI002D7A055F|nr:uncharacterized protein LOC133918061 [Phragmites australis]